MEGILMNKALENYWRTISQDVSSSPDHILIKKKMV